MLVPTIYQEGALSKKLHVHNAYVKLHLEMFSNSKAD